MGPFHVGLIVLIVITVILLPVYFLIKQPVGPNRFGDVGQPMEFRQAIKAYWSNYFNFEGRASRSEFWWAMLFVMLLGFIPILSIVLGFVTLIPTTSLIVRRLHDINRRGWHALLGFLPPVGMIAMLIWECTPPPDAKAVVMYRGSVNGDLERIDKLAAMKASGTITEDEFEAAKRQILSL